MLKLLNILFFVMSGFVCDLYFFEPGTAITSATGPTNADGAVDVSVLTSSGLTPLFAINSDPAYATRTNTTGTFTGLVPGTYVINCRISDNCMKELTVVIPYVETWNTKYRIRHKSITDIRVELRFDIEKLSYTGDVLYPESTGEPIKVEWINEGGVDIFYPVIGSTCIIGLNSRNNGEFDEFENYSEKEYRGTFYINGVQKWQGFAIPMNNEEPYNWKTNYDVILCFTDGLKDLDSKEFSDDSGNHPSTRISILDAMVFCLNKTNLRLNIKEAMNIYPSGVDTGGTTSILGQIFFDPVVYLQADGKMEDCLSVMSSLLQNLLARVYQANGTWWIDNPTLKTGSAVPTRTLTSQGADFGNANVDYRVLIRKASALAPKVTFMEQSARKNHTPMYGAVKLTFDLGLENDQNLLPVDDFQDEDISNGQLKGWQIDKTNGANATAELLEEDKIKTLKISFDPAFGGEYVLISSEPITLNDPGTPFKMRFSFDLYTTPFFGTNPYIEVEYAILFEGQLSDYFLLPAISNGGNVFGNDTDQVIDGQYLRFYVTEHNNWKTVTVDIYTDPAGLSGEFPGDLQVVFRLKDNILYDYASLADLSGVDVNDASTYPLRTYANKARALWSDVFHSTGDPINIYELEAGDDADDQPNVVRGFAGPYQWNLKASVVEPTIHECWVTSIKLRNVRLAYLPGGTDPISEITYESTFGPNVKKTYELKLRHGDLPTISDTNPDPNMNYANISHGWLSRYNGIDPFGVPTSGWGYIADGGATIETPPRNLLQLLSDFIRGHYQAVRRKLTAEIDLSEVFPDFSNSFYETKTGKIYIPAALGLSARAATEQIEILEALQGTPIPNDDNNNPNPNVEPPPSVIDFDPDDFDSSDFYTE